MWQSDVAFARFLRAAEVTTLIALGMAIGAAIDNEFNLEQWLLSWSTLLAGILAVGAAFITVRAMMHTDARQQSRHEDLVKLNLRGERLVAMRAAELWAGPLKNFGNTLLSLHHELPENNDKIGFDMARSVADRASKAASNIITIFKHDSFISAASISNPETYKTVKIQEEIMRTIVNKSGYLAANVSSVKVGETEKRVDAYKEFRQSLLDSSRDIVAIAAGLEHLATEYR